MSEDSNSSIVRNKLLDKLERTIEGMSEITHNMATMLAVQTTRLQQNEKITSDLQLFFYKEREDMQERVESLHIRITNTDKYLQQVLHQTQTDILKEIKSSRDENKKQYDQVSEKLLARTEITTKKVSHIEKWMYSISGAVALVVFLISYGDHIMAAIHAAAIP